MREGFAKDDNSIVTPVVDVQRNEDKDFLKTTFLK